MRKYTCLECVIEIAQLYFRSHLSRTQFRDCIYTCSECHNARPRRWRVDLSPCPAMAGCVKFVIDNQCYKMGILERLEGGE